MGYGGRIFQFREGVLHVLASLRGLVRTPDFDLHLLRMEAGQHRMIHLHEIRSLFFNSLITVVGLTWST